MRRTTLICICLIIAACSDDGTGPEPQPTAATLTIAATAAALVPNQEVTLSATAKAADGATLTSAPINWTTGDASIATVSSTGVLKALAPGNVTITAASGAATANTSITVEQGGFVGAAGGTISGFAGGIVLVVPAGALSTGTAIRLRAITAPTPDPGFVRGSGGAVAFDGTFAVPARLTLSYSAAERPAGLPDARLGLSAVNNSLWAPISGSSVDATARTASGPISGPGSYGVTMHPSSVPCTAAQHRQFDFRLGNHTWAGPVATLTGEAEVVAEASGCSIRETLRITNGPVVRAVFFYEPGTSQWYYTSIDGTAVTRLSGGLEGANMILYNATRQSRVVWEQVTSSAHRQAGEVANGANWTRQAAGTYTRKAAASARPSPRVQ